MLPLRIKSNQERPEKEEPIEVLIDADQDC